MSEQHPRFCVFAGTTEGRELTEYLLSQGTFVTACMATEYGEELLAPAERLTVSAKRLDESEMRDLLRAGRFSMVIDATHPYAAAVTEHIVRSCADTGTEYQRLLRAESGLDTDALFVPDAAAAAEALNDSEGPVLLTTGSKEIARFSAVRGFAERVYARVLPLESSLRACRDAGLPSSHILAMQGPFTQEMNTATLRMTGARVMVTKESGGPGGFAEKAAAARELGVRLIVIGRPRQVEGLSWAALLSQLQERYGFRRPTPEVTVAGIGPGNPAALTREVADAINRADCLIGAKRMLLSAASRRVLAYDETAPEKIAAVIAAHPECRRFTVLMSGDTGFFSGTKKLLPLLRDCRVTVLPGISSLSYLCAKLGYSWEDVAAVSLHGRERNILPDIRANRRVFVLTGGADGVNRLCRSLTEAGLGTLRVTVGERLSYPDERVTTGTAAELAEGTYESLSAVFIENDRPDAALTPGLPDEAFVRGPAVPMTKSEVRAVCLSKLRLTKYAVCWDVGAGTGSVSVEMARLAREGAVYAIERSPDALALLRENAACFGLDNLRVIAGEAPAVLNDLPAPTHVFLGGTGGHVRDILELALKKNPAVRIVAAAVTLESIAALSDCRKQFPFAESEAVCVSVSRDRAAGSYHLMLGQNPVYLFTLQAGRPGVSL